MLIKVVFLFTSKHLFSLVRLGIFSHFPFCGVGEIEIKVSRVVALVVGITVKEGILRCVVVVA